ncbi:hypothetical protein BGX34_005923, partial [Mortierella sp. NVP85]
MLNYRHNSTSLDDASIDTGIEHLESQERNNYPFTLSVEDFGVSLGLTADVVQPFSPTRVCGYMQQALEGLAYALEHAPDMTIYELNILPEDEQELLLRKWNTTQQDYPEHLCIHHLFEQQVERTPQATALVFNGQSITYAELNEQANRLAHHLIGLGVQPDNVVAICVERSFAMIISVLAVLKAGGAYVPLDPAYASERLRDILIDSSPLVLVADHIGQHALGQGIPYSVVVVGPNGSEVDSGLASNAAPDKPLTNPQVSGLVSSNLAYIIYTSGSTGKPKGVMIEHQGVVNHTLSRLQDFDLDESSRGLQFSSLSFDYSVLEIFTVLSSGASLHVLPDEVRHDVNQLWKYFQQHSITHASMTPAILREGKDLWPLKIPLRFTIGGEAIPPSLFRDLYRLLPEGSRITHEYGPTETTIVALTWKCLRDFNEDVLPIGRPIDNKTIYILDKYQQPVPLGAVGELYIGGVGVARGYLNRPELTSKMFVPDPFSADKEARMYKTGDLARYLPDGNIIYIGRNDHQVKIRGFRIELGEIESRLADHPLVQSAVV